MKTEKIVEKIIVGRLKTNCYLFHYHDLTLVIDPGAEAVKIERRLAECGRKPSYLLATHGHFDHLGAIRSLKKRFPEAKFFIDKNELPILRKSGLIAPLFGCRPLLSPKPDDFLKNLALPYLRIIPTPGHSPGGACFFFKLPGKNPVLFSGDTLFSDCVGRYDFSMGDRTELKKSLKRLIKLPWETKVYPGHGEEFTLSKAGEFLPELLLEW